MYNGILVFDKPQSFTSHDVVAKMRGILRQKKIGHAGTLDPMATGVLVVLLGNATRASDYAAAQTKEYIAGLRLGTVTDSQDITGKVLEQRDVQVTQEQLEQTLRGFTGDISQLPPMFSAVSVGGVRLYKLARKGAEIEREARDIEIQDIELLDSQEREHSLRVVCSKGTYIRTLCHDIGQALGCGACMSALRRTAVGNFGIDKALSFEQVERLRDEGRLAEYILPTDSVFAHLPAVTLNEKGFARALNGAFISADELTEGKLPDTDELCRVYSPEGEFIMLGRGGLLDRGGQALFCHKTFFVRD
ncbi:MAG: tRNA pseudouridine(55) synthase TruB [Clostridia bacterium]|nr:tRNA pseudouridine(55) synthase TruB [Clostridia bacterium]